MARLFTRGNDFARLHGGTKMLPDGRVVKTMTYQSWASMNDRCTNERHKWWHAYGGRGILVCERWRRGRDNPCAFKNFIADVGERPAKDMTLDRIDVNGPYAPTHDGKLQCRWADKSTQRRNQRSACDGGETEKRDEGSCPEVSPDIPY